MDKQEINKLFKSLEETPVYIYINAQVDAMFLTTTLIDEELRKQKRHILFSKNPKTINKSIVIDLVKAFNIKTVVLPSGEIIQKELFVPKRQLIYDDSLQEYTFPYGKKLIFLIKKTRSEALIRILSKKKLILLAKPNDKNINIDVFNCEINGKKYIPTFGDSNFLRTFLEKSEATEYKPYIMSFKKIANIAKHSNIDIYLNPYSYAVQGKDFSFIISLDLIKYINEVIKPRFSTK